MSKTAQKPVPAADETIPVQVERVFHAPPERVFDAWLDAKTLGEWLFATPEGKMLEVEADPRVGGAFRIAEQRGDVVANHLGEYVEIERPRRLAFRFRYAPEGEAGTPATLVELDFHPHPDGCLLRLTHHIDAAWAAYLERTREGWIGILRGLATLLAEHATH